MLLINDLLGGDVRAQAQRESFGPTLTQKPGSTLASRKGPSRMDIEGTAVREYNKAYAKERNQQN